MKPWDRTTMGGGQSRFQTTHWPCILSAKTTDTNRRRIILANLTETYWKPVYCYLRKKGLDNEQAKDLTQDFFAEVVMGTDLVQKADQAKGSFRAFLRVALKRYLASDRRRAGRLKRGGHVFVMHCDLADMANLNTLDSLPGPDQAFYYSWITDLLDQVLAEVKNEYCSTDRQGHWEVFRQRLLEPLRCGAQPVRFSTLCELYGIENEKTASNMIETVKRRFRSVLMRRLKDLTTSDREAEAEFQEILEFLSTQRAG